MLRVAFLVVTLFLPAAGQTLQGTIRDPQSHPVAGVNVSLLVEGDSTQATTQTDSQGSYRFKVPRFATYKVRAEKAGYSPAASASLRIADSGQKRVDLILTALAEFFDEPHFVVAGVTDPSNIGGHGSQTVLRSTDSLTQATASMTDLKQMAGNAIEVARAYQLAAETDPTETHLSDWGADLLIHRAPTQAAAVFTKGHRLFAGSVRMLLGLGAALYAQGSYGEAAQRFFEAADLNPADAAPYLFLGKVQTIEITQLDGYAERLARFAQRQPDNALANYYYAVCLWKRRSDPDERHTIAKVQHLLETAVRLDSTLGEAFVQLGILYSSLKDFRKAISCYSKAVETGGRVEEAHYRLAQAYQRIGEKQKAQRELEIHERLVKTSEEQADRQRNEIGQFVFSLRRP